MKKLMTICAALIMTASVFAQAPEKMSYQAVVRDGSNNLVSSTAVGMQISILQGSASGTAVYVERQFPSTNTNGLVSLEIGAGTVVSGNFATIDWANGQYFIKTETDLNGGTNYTITGTSQLMSVPYALHATTADSISGTITETDPIFTAWDKSTGISITESQISDLNHFTTSDETDPVYGSSVASGITGTDTTNWNNESDPLFSDWDKSTGISITESQISDLNHFTTADETDPVYGASVASGITGTDTTNWNNKLDSYTETDPSVPTGTQTGEMQYWNGSEWITVAAGNEGQVLTFVSGVPTWKTQLEDGDVENPTTGKVWMDRNLGASQVATSSTDALAYGDLYQWGRAADGHESRTSSTTTTLSTTDTPGHGDFITNGTSPYDWRNPQNDTLWQGVSGINNPCPTGYRLPTEAEWTAELASWSSGNAAGAFASPLKLPVAGVRHYNTGSLVNVGIYGSYWSSTVSSTLSRVLNFNSSNAYMFSDNRAVGFSVRCLKD